MEKYIFEGKTIDEAINLASETLKVTKEDILYKVLEEKNSILKKHIKIEVININNLIDYIKNLILELTNSMELEVNLEVRRREEGILIKIFSSNNAVLIGKDGRTIASLQNIIRQIVRTKTNHDISIVLDVENYKENKIKKIESLAKKVAREVTKTKIEVKLDSMNSFERRIVHNVLSNNNNVFTESIGEEPNRSVVIKPKE